EIDRTEFHRTSSACRLPPPRRSASRRTRGAPSPSLCPADRMPAAVAGSTASETSRAYRRDASVPVSRAYQGPWQRVRRGPHSRRWACAPTPPQGKGGADEALLRGAGRRPEGGGGEKLPLFVPGEFRG